MYSPEFIQEMQNMRGIYPKTPYKALNSLHSAYTQFIDELLGKKKFSLSYKGTSHEKLGKSLLKIYMNGKGGKGDMPVINKWVKVLGLEGWFEWKQA